MLLIDVHADMESVDASDDILKANRLLEEAIDMEDLRCCKKGYVANENVLRS